MQVGEESFESHSPATTDLLLLPLIFSLFTFDTLNLAN
jgi:hypothetical protein